MRHYSFLVGLVAITVACSSGLAPTSPPDAAPGADVTPQAEPRLERYASPADGFETNSFWLATGAGVVVFDTQFLPEYTRELLDRIGRATSEPVTDVVVLHGNPDKYNGIGAIRERFPAVRVWASERTVARIREVDPGKRAYFGPVYGRRYPQALDLPDQTFVGRATVRVGETAIELIELGGAGVSTNHVVARLPGGGLLVGDLVHPRVHGWLAEGFSDQWLARLDELSALGARTVYPGRGEATAADEAIDAQRRYLRRFQAAVAPYAARELTDADAQAIRRTIVAAFPEYALDAFVDFSLPAEHARQRAALAAGDGR